MLDLLSLDDVDPIPPAPEDEERIHSEVGMPGQIVAGHPAVQEEESGHPVQVFEDLLGGEIEFDPPGQDCWLCLGGHDLTVERIQELKHQWPDLYHRLFIDEGLGEVLVALEGHMEAKTATIKGINTVVEGVHA